MERGKEGRQAGMRLSQANGGVFWVVPNLDRTITSKLPTKWVAGT